MDINEKFVITISREIGSGGRTVGRKLAEKLNVRYCDNGVIEALMQRFNLTSAEIEKLKAAKKTWMSDFIQKLTPVPKASQLLDDDAILSRDFLSDVTSEDIFRAEEEIIRSLVEESSCVFAGRAGFFVLKEHPNKLDFFITASKDKRIARVMVKQNLTREQAGDLIDKIDKSRENYVQRYAGVSRYDARNYDLVLKIDTISEDQAVDLILDFIKRTGA